jgi:PAS domain S-box-containing protein
MEVDTVIIITTLLSFAGGLVSWIIFRVVKPTMKFINKHEDLASSVETIKQEITTNGGGSLKDVVCKLGESCDRIEHGQKIIEQRTKASLHYNSTALFETDSKGKAVWTNEPFYELTGQHLPDVEGYDWLAYVHEEDREELFMDFQSCLDLSRKFQREVKTFDDKRVRMLGFPYKLNGDEQGGFLVSVSEITIREVNNG